MFFTNNFSNKFFSKSCNLKMNFVDDIFINIINLLFIHFEDTNIL